ncbi:ADP-ribosylglycohydrolase [Guyanagaster necrorhizus]|uniref:ADP-ribosylhydrolase ARH3 n=1 Tax=Guyanagaster necrorhizus TaxID=856835 RepID=A0A9P7W303_9AGAR|nr:ADP-ribosylglycohydrolase [Guyanagaster necrorhizus MCA 3950]KAG7451035.1 ADP-ribosylglycohydrolase [Guyanagaster necrorhizus MCA 3950]
MNTPLYLQNATKAAPATKIRTSILATALVDALGGPAEFQTRFSFDVIDSMIPNANFSLPPGVWTDDTSMTLCLAQSLATYRPNISTQPGGFDECHQLAAFTDWWKRGVLSATGICFDIGNTIRRALTIYSNNPTKEPLRRIHDQLSGEFSCGNGSLMRVIPIGLAYWRDETQARGYARRSSTSTHPNDLCKEACEVWTGAICKIMASTTTSEDPDIAKLDLLSYFTTFPYSHPKLRELLALPSFAPSPPSAAEELEIHYRHYHPLMKLISECESEAKDSKLPLYLPQPTTLPSSGYVVDTLVAALYCFFSTNTFEQGAIVAVNMGDDADTIGAVYGGLAGCWYGTEPSMVSDTFWSAKVEKWYESLVAKDIIADVSEALVTFSKGLAK